MRAQLLLNPSARYKLHYLQGLPLRAEGFLSNFNSPLTHFLDAIEIQH